VRPNRNDAHIPIDNLQKRYTVFTAKLPFDNFNQRGESVNYVNELEFAQRTALDAGVLLLDFFGKAQEVEQKSRTDFRTRADREADLLIRGRIEKYYPLDAINSEELDAKETGSQRRWIVDPLDGTTGFVLGDWNFCVAIGLAVNGKMVLGVIYCPKRETCYWAAAHTPAIALIIGRGCTAIRVSDEINLNRAIIALEPGKAPGRERKADMERRLLADDGARISLTWASAAVSLAAVAAGNLDGFVGHKLEPWDMAAAVPILLEAGAKVTNIAGEPWQIGDESIVAANPALHDQILRRIN